MADPKVLTERRDRTFIVTINRPEVRNCVNGETAGLLEAAVEGDLESEYSAQYRSHFVSSILGIAPEGSAYWGVFLWNETAGAWEPLPVGADLFSVKDGHVMGWALIEYDPDNPRTPTSKP